jgi:hypothetical protein
METDVVRSLPIISSVASLTAILSSMTVRLCIISSVASRAGVVLFRNPASWILKNFSSLVSRCTVPIALRQVIDDGTLMIMEPVAPLQIDGRASGDGSRFTSWGRIQMADEATRGICIRKDIPAVECLICPSDRRRLRLEFSICNMKPGKLRYVSAQIWKTAGGRQTAARQ